MVMKLKISYRFIPFLPIIFCLFCSIPPQPVYRLSPLAEETLWLKGKEYAKIKADSLLIALAFDKYLDDNFILDICVVNQSNKNVLVSPETFYYHAVYNLNNSKPIKSVKIQAIDPELKILEIDKSSSRETAHYISEMGKNGFLTFLDFISDITTITISQTEEEDKEEELEDKEREIASLEDELQHANSVRTLKTLRDEWELQALRKTTLKPDYLIRGKVYFPINNEAKQYELYFPVGESISTITFKQEVFEVN
jgi:hypothetical protein